MQILSMKMMFCTLLLLLLAVTSCVHSEADCSQAQSCDLCVGNSMLNLTGCVWRLCPDGNDTGMCVTDEGNTADNSRNCSWTRVSELCTVVETVAEGGGDSGAGGKARPQLSPARFNLSSFIGGVVLVLCLQAGGVLAMRFLKSKEQSDYDPIEQPQ
ncbi:CD164 sialomucin-like 2 protein [Hippocampus comes]|uniref:CD164 sialomucin-like 2 protein n=1 Tax=Hippocampus comes TaxID=109280 RepID=UPI00094F2E15|nr:PREDICTED: CD164 sialomucin-like 2 protein [Hippocampus comes]